jgi:cytochrome d ubiquinol oxidase subunit II
MGLIASIGMPEIVAGVMVLALNAYVLMGGADFGGGVWDLFAGGPRRDAQRQLIASSIGPVWEANHVWLIVSVVLLFTAFPVAFSTLGIVLHIPISLMLIGIVLRGSAFVFRSYGSGVGPARRRWSLAFASASILTPLMLGIIIGTIATGEVGTASGEVGAESFARVFVWPWLAPFPIAVGCFALALFAFLAAVYLTVDAAETELADDFRRRGLIMAILVFVTAAIALALSHAAAPRVSARVADAPWSIVLHLCTALAAITAIVALWRRRYRVARLAAIVQVSCILWGWAFAQYPFIIPMTLTIRQASAPAVTLTLLLCGLAGGGAILIPSLRYLLRTFHGADDSITS